MEEKMRCLALALFGLSSANASIASAETCDISQFKDYMSYSKDIMTNLAYIDQVVSQEDRSKSDSANIAVSDYGSFTYGDASKISSQIKTLLDIKWSQHDQEQLLTNSLTDKGVSAYIGCLNSNNANFIVTLSPSASNSDEFIVNYTWAPHYKAPNPAKISAILLNATSTNLPKKVNTPESGAFSVKRGSMYKALELDFHIDGQPYPTISLPAFPKKVLQTQVRQTVQPGSVYGGGNSLVKNVCVTLDNNEQDAFIVPNSLQSTVETSITERAQLLKGAVTYNPREACQTFIWHLEAADGHVVGMATVKATVLKAVEVKTDDVVQVIGNTEMFKGQAAQQ
jgi:hypothetical protein